MIEEKFKGCDYRKSSDMFCIYLFLEKLEKAIKKGGKTDLVAVLTKIWVFILIRFQLEARES